MQTHMKYILFISVVILTSCFNSNSNSNYEKFNIDKSEIDFIEIRKRVDTVSMRLSENQIESFIKNLGNSEPGGPLKIFAEYYLILHLKNGIEIEYKTEVGTITANGGLSYRINDKEYFALRSNNFRIGYCFYEQFRTFRLVWNSGKGR